MQGLLVPFATGTIHNTEETDPSRLSIADAEATEGEDQTLDFVVTLDPAAAQTVTVDYATADGTATAGDDYTATSGTLTFDPGETSQTIAVPITDDTEETTGDAHAGAEQRLGRGSVGCRGDGDDPEYGAGVVVGPDGEVSPACRSRMTERTRSRSG